MGLTAAQETDEDVLRTLKVGTHITFTRPYIRPHPSVTHAAPSKELLLVAHDSIEFWRADDMELT